MPSLTVPQPETDIAPRAHLYGVAAAVVTPFAEDGEVELEVMTAHCRSLLVNGATGVCLFGTTGEGASLGLGDRDAVLSAVVDSGVAVDTITTGLAAPDLDTAWMQARLALDRGIKKLLLPPPFYFKGVSDDGVFRWVSDFVDGLAADDPQIILYHIPQVTGVRFDAALVRRLKDTYPDAIFGLKDSEGSWDHSAELLPMDDLVVLIGDERSLARAAPLGGAGAISGMANILPGRVDALVRLGRADPQMDSLIDEIVKVPVTPMIKALVGAQIGRPEWARTRAPLCSADTAIVATLAERVMSLQD